MQRQERPFNNRSLNGGSWAVLLLALGYILSAMLLVGYAYQLPSDGWTFDTNGDSATAIAPITNPATPLSPGDQLLAVDGTAVPSTDVILRPAPPPPNWQIGQTVEYTVLRAGQPVNLKVTLQKLSFADFLRSYRLGGNIWLTNLLWYVIGFAVFFLRPRDTAARLLLLFTTYWNTVNVFMQRIEGWNYSWRPPGYFYTGMVLNLLWVFMFGMMVHFVLTFPLRKWPLTRRPRLALGLLYGIPAVSLALALITGNFTFYNAALLPMITILVIALVAATAHNLWRVHDRVVRAQIGWVALGIASPLVGAFGPPAIAWIFPALEATLSNWIWNFASLLLPICFGIAITRYRLFDIDVIIRKTLVYAVLSGLLALVYFGSVVLLQNVIGRTADEQSPLVIVISTLIIAALFAPMRQRVQAFIDRRFYRQKYDAQQILAQFAQTARDEVEIEALTSELVHVVQETMQPASISLWIKNDAL
ncbi:MAG: hypothetical protein H6659_19035 [Ardenticatenaceae bacterium]|nr:hypothetical protein [Ardenticatenaceae bacterium]